MKKGSVKLIIYLSVLTCLVSSCSSYQALFRKPSIHDGEDFGRRAFPASQSDPYHFAKQENIKLPPLDLWADKKAINNYSTVDEFLQNTYFFCHFNY